MSDHASPIIAGLAALERDGVDDLSMADATAMLAAAIRIATAKSEETDENIPLSDRDVSATQAVTVASVLLRAQHLNAFDLELWSAGKHGAH